MKPDLYSVLGAATPASSDPGCERSSRARTHANQLTHPNYTKPELVATGPNQTWSWDIERHEALLNLAVVRDHRHRPVAAGRLKLRAA